MPLNIDTVRWLLRGLLLLMMAWAAVVTTSTLLDDRTFNRQGRPVCAALEAAHAAREPDSGFTIDTGRPDAGTWSVRARYTYEVGGTRYANTQIWPWGHGHTAEAVHEAAADMWRQQRENGCLRITVDSASPQHAVVYTAPLRTLMQRQMWGVGLVFLALLFLELALGLWASRRAAVAPVGGERAQGRIP